MRVATATAPGHDGRPNEDFVGVAPGAVVLLDGAGIPGTEDICHHGVAWYAHTLGESLVARLTLGDPLPAALADAIEQVAGLHRGTCDLANPSSPQATVAMLRVTDDRVEHLVLADAYVVLHPAGAGPRVVTDPREVTVRRECSSPLEGLTVGTPEHERAWGTVVESFRARRNRPGGYWIAKEDPRVVEEAVTGTTDLGDLLGAALLSNGASRYVEPYRLADWPAVLALLRTAGPDELLRRLRRAEDGSGAPDDATAAYCDLLDRR